MSTANVKTADEKHTPPAKPEVVETAKPAKHAAAAPQTHQVSITAAGFAPAALAIKAGDSVCWTNSDNGKHSVKFVTKADEPAVASGGIYSNKTFEKVFDTAGTFEYACESHPAMRGTVTVS